MTVTAIIVAAGRGTRVGGDKPKQYQNLAGRAVLARTVEAFAAHPRIGAIVVVLRPEDGVLFETSLAGSTARVTTVPGGATRDASVQAGLRAAPDGTTRVLIHDGARPLVGAALIGRVIDALDDSPGAAPALPVTDALWQGRDGKVEAPHPRNGLYRAQTPQGFHLRAILAAHEAHPGGAADDVEVALAAGLDVAIVEGDEDNLKITHKVDFARAERVLRERNMDIRTGNGFDVHAFCEGDGVILCGIKVPHDKALKGHSDADVGMHTVTDAIYGALAEGDIGRHFPPSDPQWKGAASEIFLKHAVALAAERGFRISNVDLTLICERPKIGPVAGAMQAEMARLMGMEEARVSVKATTSERLGFTGREEGIAALATVTLVAP
ncbi:bifunctional 2-C-methyl-D-erythritol 4-phosphate cytidylyltransferase/2-C-methyl-D-erythritol 2,4-cyclodiphosphate synthase [Rhodovulum sp. MB263]|uniref:bifunctional 2-C-methyl-D-erythritol 4-phosphate cytidylyltransferase/2-C-methyl-D-erythritol 2,4-cyclodiphosphate synthase n=1 Tax=Rhodovulum sp. (strain MB263) TaxID=308754 RepID=UPI0009B71F59|nr:bifunctional 2-C-methyl-D-erythritol 4-phosphate cytidylyltransferase/2-C-methyl-D-erythritol 2,4-cyclodiphosphate synthase [Rhodovulum sp. MB263]ARC88893.1 bifunctional 2-C-methyl-D-erythritol 4-phosphate cytidylyltransferase/2-C-methyl-D-erythritol 2,4-cyclodiphosphate synthase [Rhodovulum sp. MB263]